MRIAPEMIAAGAKAIVNGNTSSSAVAIPSARISRDSRMLEHHVRCREHGQERQHRTETYDLSDGADHHQSHQQHELPLPAACPGDAIGAPASWPGFASEALAASRAVTGWTVPPLRSRGIAAPLRAKRTSRRGSTPITTPVRTMSVRFGRCAFGNDCRIDDRERVLRARVREHQGLAFRSRSGCTSRAASRRRSSLRSACSGTRCCAASPTSALVRISSLASATRPFAQLAATCGSVHSTATVVVPLEVVRGDRHDRIAEASGLRTRGSTARLPGGTSSSTRSFRRMNSSTRRRDSRTACASCRRRRLCRDRCPRGSRAHRTGRQARGRRRQARAPQLA